MSLSESKISEAVRALLGVYEDLNPIDPLTSTYPEITVEDSYKIQIRTVNAWQAEGKELIGKKIGLTSTAMQEMIGVNEPDYGHLFDHMLIYQDFGIRTSQLLQPRVEGEIAFILGKDLVGPGITPADVLRSTAGVCASLEIIDSRIRDWKIKIQDTIADNASSAAFVLSDTLIPLREINLRNVGFVFSKNGKIVATGAGAAVLGSPAQAVAWLANRLASYGVVLRAGEIILSGSAVPAVPVQSGDSIHLTVDRIGEVSCFFEK